MVSGRNLFNPMKFRWHTLKQFKIVRINLNCCKTNVRSGHISGSEHVRCSGDEAKAREARLAGLDMYIGGAVKIFPIDLRGD